MSVAVSVSACMCVRSCVLVGASVLACLRAH